MNKNYTNLVLHLNNQKPNKRASLRVTIAKAFIFLLLSTMSIGLNAQTATAPAAGDGSIGNPYQIATLNNLYWIQANTANWNKHYIQTANINASGTSTWNSATGWMPIGNSTTRFTGRYNGGHYSISNLYINRPGTMSQGLFGSVDASIIQAVHLVNANITGGYLTGALAGSVNVSDVLYCSSTGTVTGGRRTGGLVGSMSNGYFFKNCYSTCNVTGEDYVGGLVGDIGGNVNITFSDCYAQGSVTATKATDAKVGGLAGFLNTAIFTRCYSTGLVTGATPKGGLVGDCYTTGSNNFWDTETSGLSTGSTGSTAGTGKTTTQMKDFFTYYNATWTIGQNKTWGINSTDNNGYPFSYYQGFTSYDIPSVSTQSVSGISGITATANGNVTFVGLPLNTQHGHCWATTTNPTITNSKTELGIKTDTGSFTSAITDLLPVTTYYVRSYVTNSLGTFYGSQQSFISGKKTLYITGDFTAKNKEYAGETSTVATINVNNLSLSGVVVNYPTVSLSISLRFEDGNAGDNKRVYIYAPSLTGTHAAKYTLSVTGVPETTANITKKPLYASFAVADNKSYDGLTDATISGLSLTGKVTGDVVSIGTASGTFASKNVGTGIPVTSTMTLTGTHAANYTLTQPTSLKANITAKALTIATPVAASKVYNGNVNTTISGTLSGVETGDVVSILSNAGAFANKTVGTGKSVTASMTITGTDATNYTLTQPTGLTATITAKALTVTGATVSNKEYDGTTTATISGAGLSGVETSDVVNISNHTSGTFANKNVGTGKSVSTSMTISGTDYANYTLTQPTLTANITARPLTVTANSFNKTQGVAYTFAGNEFSVSNLATGDAVTSATITSTGSGSGVAVNTYPIVISNAVGTGLANYNISYVNGTLTVINKTELTIAGLIANNKVYNGNTTATISNWGALQGIAGGDVVTLNTSGASINFENKLVGNSKSVTVTGLALSGTDAAKYYINNQITSANITTKALTVTGASAQSKVYDANIATTISSTGLSGIVGSDVVSINSTAGSFANKTVGANKTVTSALTITGADAANYTLTQPTGLTANITAKSLSINGTFTVLDKIFDGNVAATINNNSLGLSGVESSDVVSISTVTAEFENATAGINKQVNITSVTLNGTDKNNYSVSLVSSPTSTATITSTTTVNELRNNELSIYPNPTSGILFINSDKIIQQVELLNIAGQVQVLKVNSGTPQSIDLSKMPKGVYLIKVLESGVNQYAKVIVQ